VSRAGILLGECGYRIDESGAGSSGGFSPVSRPGPRSLYPSIEGWLVVETMRQDHWNEEGLPTWDVKVGDRVRQGADPDSKETGKQRLPPIGTLGTVTWLEGPSEWRGGPPEVWVRWDGVRYANAEDSSLASWVEPMRG
jgi:hypothetical protein